MARSWFRPEIEGLRAIAVLLVLAYHFKVPGFDGGFVGVDVFFTISGYLITALLLQSGRLDRSQIADFYARRLRRIVPLSSLVLLASAAAIWILLGSTRLKSMLYDFMASALFAGNIPATAAGEYLSGVRLPSPLRHYWSLAVEEQFYLVWPIVLAGLVKILPKMSLKVVVRCASLATIAVSLSASILLSATHPAAAYYLPHTRAWEIALGALVATLPVRRTMLGPVLSSVLLVASLVFADASSVYPGWLALLPTLAAASILYTCSADSFAGKLLSIGILRRVGAWSFGLYLWHWPVITIWEEKFGYLTLLSSMAALLLTVALTLISYYSVEQPLRTTHRFGFSLKASLPILPVASSIALLIPVASLFAPTVSGAKNSTTDALVTQIQVPKSLAQSGGTSDAVLDQSTPTKASVRTVTLLGDSTLAPLRWFVGADRSLRGFPYTMDAESCRKLANKGCDGREGRVPPSAVETIKTLELTDTLVIMAGYHSYPDTIAKEFVSTIEAARTRGFSTIVWLTLRESPSFPGVAGAPSVYTLFNDLIGDKLSSKEFDDVVVFDWNSYASARPEWFTKDGIHVKTAGALALGDFISYSLAALDGRPCPSSTKVSPCPGPPHAPTSASILAAYEMVDTTEHCYEMGEERSIKCKTDRMQK